MDCSPTASSVDELIKNAELRTELERYADESISRVAYHRWTLREENQFLSSMLLWEKAPILPIYRWFEPELKVPSLRTLSDEELSDLLQTLVWKLFEKHIVLDFTDHLSDRELYHLIVHEILPANEKKIDTLDVYHHWDCSRGFARMMDESQDEDQIEVETWLTYYATDEQRERWAETHEEPLPEKRPLPHHRGFPQDKNFHYFY